MTGASLVVCDCFVCAVVTLVAFVVSVIVFVVVHAVSGEVLAHLVSVVTGADEGDALSLDHEAELEEALQGVVMEIEATKRRTVVTLPVSRQPV